MSCAPARRCDLQCADGPASRPQLGGSAAADPLAIPYAGPTPVLGSTSVARGPCNAAAGRANERLIGLVRSGTWATLCSSRCPRSCCARTARRTTIHLAPLAPPWRNSTFPRGNYNIYVLFYFILFIVGRLNGGWACVQFQALCCWGAGRKRTGIPRAADASAAVKAREVEPQEYVFAARLLASHLTGSHPTRVGDRQEVHATAHISLLLARTC